MHSSEWVSISVVPGVFGIRDYSWSLNGFCKAGQLTVRLTISVGLRKRIGLAAESVFDSVCVICYAMLASD
ncbi:MAG TPA: hypothetical protein DCG12_19735 [Planctomycetaceae bacterium]|nr:hypothetical protein [Planctomycetaceae bacterium]